MKRGEEVAFEKGLARVVAEECFSTDIYKPLSEEQRAAIRRHFPHREQETVQRDLAGSDAAHPRRADPADLGE